VARVRFARRARAAALAASLVACAGPGDGAAARPAAQPSGSAAAPAPTSDTGPSAARGQRPRTFDASLVPGLVAPVPARYEDVRLDADLGTKGGGDLKVTSCTQLAEIPESSVAGMDYASFRDLRVGCLALRRFAASVPATRSFFPERLTAALVRDLPAEAVTLVSPEDLRRRRSSRAPLATYEKGVRFQDDTVGAVVVTSAGGDTRYHVLARADFDRDGAEDLLVRTEWSARGGRGTGTDLLLLSKPSASAPVTVAWRAPLDSLSTAPAALLR